ncbi:probable transcription factor At3g04930 [Rutidosis leptorrhynchoides]|uniref:probable transcription factor At3g04930 n=1 Tax=Rutidosis leptorrhynchoides TaxID=125765 RepID=UPI003A99521F
MAAEQHDAVFGHTLDDGDDNYDSLSQDDEEEEELINDDDEDEVIEDLNSPSAIINNSNSTIETPAVDGIMIPVAVAAAPSVVTVASVPNGDDAGNIDHMIEATTPIATRTVVQEERKPPAILDDSRRLFQRLWTDEDEIELLQGFLDYMTQRGGTASGSGGHHHYDTALFYDQIKSKLQLDFNKNQLVEKLRRLKKKYRNVVSKLSSGKDFTFKSPHDQATFEISRKIWTDIGAKNGSSVAGTVLEDEDGNNFTTNMNLCNIEVRSEEFGAVGEKKPFITPCSSKSRPRKRARSKFDIASDEKGSLSDALMANATHTPPTDHIINNNSNNYNNNTNGNTGGGANGSGNMNPGVVVAGVIEETVRSCFTPLLKELRTGMGGFGGRGGLNGLAMNAMPFNFASSEVVSDERWRKQQILELEVYSKRLELVQDEIKTALNELRSVGGSSVS